MYKKYNDEWEKEMMKNTKKVIIQMLRRVAIERDRLEAVEHRLAPDKAYMHASSDENLHESSVLAEFKSKSRLAGKV